MLLFIALFAQDLGVVYVDVIESLYTVFKCLCNYKKQCIVKLSHNAFLSRILILGIVYVDSWDCLC